MPTDRGYRGYVDRCWPEAYLIVEIDGRSWHAREAAMAADRARDRTAARVGWQTLRILDEELTDCPVVVVDDLVTAYLTRLGQLRAAG
jgi:very-short-patch-repair endonuclease